MTNFFINKKLLKELDYGMIGIAIAIMIFSALNIYSATHMEWGTFFLKKTINLVSWRTCYNLYNFNI